MDSGTVTIRGHLQAVPVLLGLQFITHYAAAAVALVRFFFGGVVLYAFGNLNTFSLFQFHFNWILV